MGLIVFASSIAANVAGFTGAIDSIRIVLFGLAGMLAAIAALLTAVLSKNLSAITLCTHGEY